MNQSVKFAIQFRIDVIKSIIEDTEKRMKKDEELLKQPGVNTFFAQHGISMHKGYLQGLNYALRELESLQKVK
jgi:hypothetical protein